MSPLRLRFYRPTGEASVVTMVTQVVTQILMWVTTAMSLITRYLHYRW